MTKPRRADIWSKHTNIVHAPSKGSPFRDAAGFGDIHKSCIRCGVHRPQSELQADAQMRYQKRCIDRELCATARGGKS